MKRGLHGAVAMLLVMLLLITSMPMAALAEIVKVDTSSGIQPFSILPGGTAVLTYEFYVGGELVDTQRVGDGETLVAPKTPTQDGHKFMGWTEDPNVSNPTYQSFGTPINVTGTETIKLYAHFEEVYYVFFMDNNGRVYETRWGTSGYTIEADVTFPVGPSQAVTGWKVQNTENRVENVQIASENIFLEPIIEEGHWITFDSQGGTYIEPVFYTNSATTQPPAEPSRSGFTFAGWELNGSDFVFGNALTQDIVLVAKWTPQEAPYTVIHWWENADDEGYSYHESETLYGPTGNTTTAQAKTYTEQGYTTFTALTDESGNLVDPAGNPVQMQIAGDGSTIVNIYYQRAEFTIYFYHGTESQLTCGKEAHRHTYVDRKWISTGLFQGHYEYTGGCYGDEWNRYPQCEKQEHRHTSNCYGNDNVIYKSITAKHGAWIEDQWPGGNWSTTESGGPYQASIETMPIGGDEFWWTNSEDPGYEPEEGTPGTSTATYYVEVVEGNQGVDGGKPGDSAQYIVHHKDTIKNPQSVGGWQISQEDFYDIAGFTQNYYKDGDNQIHNNGDFGSGMNTYPYKGAAFYYSRNRYDVVYYNGDNIVKTTSYQYGADISEAGVYTPDRPEGVPSNYTFGGWYDNPEGVGNPFDFNRTMPIGNITVYAKWIPPTYTVTIQADMDGSEDPKEVMTVPEGTVLNETELDPYKPDLQPDEVWHGWATRTVDGNNVTYTPFNFDTEIHQDTVLYPYYTSNASFTVSYNLNGGTGTKPTDGKNYAQYSYADVMPANNVVAPNGQVFLHWNTSADGSGTSVYPGDRIQITDNVTLYAIYGPTPEGTQITYIANYPEGTDPDPYVDSLANNAEHTVLGLEAAGFSAPEGYEFVGWSTNEQDPAENIRVDYEAGAKIIVNKNDDTNKNFLYGCWKPKKGTLVIEKILPEAGGGGKQFTFEVRKQGNNEVVRTVTVTVNGTSGSETITLPEGMYTVTEKLQNNQDYYEQPEEQTVTVRRGDEERVIFTNTLKKYTVTIEKQVTGNMYNTNDEFEFKATVTFEDMPYRIQGSNDNEYKVDEDGTITFTLKGGQSVVLLGVPKHAIVTVEETDRKDYETSYQMGSNDPTKDSTATINVQSDMSVTFINDKTVTIDTGVNLDVLPYLLMLAVAGGAVALLLVLKRRKTQE